MRKFVLSASLCLFVLAGCAESSETLTNPAEPANEAVQQQAVEPHPTPQAQKTKKVQKAVQKKGHKSEATIREELKATGHKLVTRASRTITPSKANKSVHKSGNEFIASYVHIDPQKFSTDMRPSSHAGSYNGFIRYSEQVYHCKGKTRQEALSAPCHQVSSRRVNEMIHYDGTRWNY